MARPKSTKSSFAPATEEDVLRMSNRPEVIVPPSGTVLPSPITEVTQPEKKSAPVEEPDPSPEIVEEKHSFRPELGLDGKKLPPEDALDAAIEKAEKERREATRKAEEEEAAAEKAKEEKKEEPIKEEKAEESAKVGEKEEPAKVVEALKAAADTEEPSDEELLTFLKPKAARKFRRIAGENKELKTVKADLEAKLKEAAEKAAAPQGDPKATEELNALREEVKHARRLRMLDADPEIKAKYDEPIAQAEANIRDILKNYNVGEASLGAIDAAGGFDEFSKSSRVFTVTVKDENDQLISKQLTAEELVDDWEKGMKRGDREDVQAYKIAQKNLRFEKKRFLDSEAKKAGEYFKQREAEASKATKAQEELVAKNRDKFQKFVEKTLKEPQFQDKPVPANATEEQRKALVEYNETMKQVRAIPGSIHNDDPEKLIKNFEDLLLDAMLYHPARLSAAEKDRKIAALEGELEKIKGGLKTTGKGGVFATKNAQEKVAPKKVDPRTIDTVAEFEKALEAKENED